MLVPLKTKNKNMKRNSKKSVKLMEYYQMPSKNLAMMPVKIWTVTVRAVPPAPIHHLEVSVNQWMQPRCLRLFSETEMGMLECIMRSIITLALEPEVIMATICLVELSSNSHRKKLHTYMLLVYICTIFLRFLQIQTGFLQKNNYESFHL